MGKKQQSRAQFATGMNGDEDLGEDIIMKGEPYHYNQKRPANQKLFATGMNGDEDLGEDIIMKGEPFHYNQKKQSLAQINAAPVDDGAEKVLVLQTPIAGGHTSFYAQKQ